MKRSFIIAAILSGWAAGAGGDTWTSIRLPDLPISGFHVSYRSPQAAILADGRLIHAQGRYYSPPESRFWVQDKWGSGQVTQVEGPMAFDPAFIAIKDETNALIGAGGDFGVDAPVYTFDPSDPGATSYTHIADLQQFQGAYWASSTSAAEGWLVGGQNGASNMNAVSYLSLNGMVNTVVVDQVSAYSGGLAVDTNGDVYVVAYSLSGPTDTVYRFSCTQIEQAISGITLTLNDGQLVYAFDSAASIAVDQLGRIWAGGYRANGYMQVYDPATGGIASITPDHPALTSPGSLMYQPITFSRSNTPYIAYTVRDAYDSAPEYYYGYAKAADVVVSNTVASWRRFHFGAAVDDPGQESTLWGDLADPDNDGVKNLAEYAFHTDPGQADALASRISVSVSHNTMEIGFRRDPKHSDIDYAVELSGNLLSNNWTETALSSAGMPTQPSGTNTATIVESPEGDCVWVTVADPQPAQSGSPRFGRIVVTRP